MNVSKIVCLTIVLALLAGLTICTADNGNGDDAKDKDKIKIKEKKSEGDAKIEYEGEIEGERSDNQAISVPIDTPSQRYTTDVIRIKNTAYDPSSLTIPVGSVVTWHNEDGTEHTVTSDLGIFDSGRLPQGKKFTLRFDAPGRYPYHCSYHPSMKGTIIVTGSGGTGIVAGASSQTVSGTSSQSVAGASSQAVVVLDQSQVQFSSQYSSETVIEYSQYYRTAPQTLPPEPIIPPVVYDIRGNEPQALYLPGEPEPITYAQYQSFAADFGGALWIEGVGSWTQYAVIPRGALINLVATAVAEGDADFYWMRPGNTYTVSRYHLSQHNRLGFYADQAGRHVFFFIQGNRPSMPVVVDVVEVQQAAPA